MTLKDLKNLLFDDNDNEINLKLDRKDPILKTK